MTPGGRTAIIRCAPPTGTSGRPAGRRKVRSAQHPNPLYNARTPPSRAGRRISRFTNSYAHARHVRYSCPIHRDPPRRLHAARVPHRQRRARIRPGARAHRGAQHHARAPQPRRRAHAASRTARRIAGIHRRARERPAGGRGARPRARPDGREPAGRLRAVDRQRLRAGRQHHAVGPLRVERQLLHAVRGGRLSPHHLLPRPPRRDGDLHGHAARRQARLPGAAVQRQPGRFGRAARGPSLRQVGRPVPQAQLPVRAGGGQAGRDRGDHHRRLGREEAAAGLGRAA